ncbi:aminoacyl-tRNA deacylase [Ktedonosporobacter rubrisoli]|uniref:Cys-tRNA(Pro)/Cys-tRNA(Cys) deacylase n=1 Tax=Ktedonosporobacter rubrisoli TaxID=2509675 RepID=A0A4P6JJM5_KTERU|nr:YbaK/EbsC family protein [Ktedonosporobacter rubrisoli]QBD75325.1 aminoacyl-tRNA deacylase [Ktedonosporobacter rubrisoli]
MQLIDEVASILRQKPTTQLEAVMAKEARTMAMRFLDARKISYIVHRFPDTIRDAEQVAAELGMDPAQVFKTLVALREDAPQSHPLLVMVPANQHIDLRQLARAVGAKSVRMASHEQAEKLTGLKVGGISALALLNRPFDVYLDEHARAFPQIIVSGGQRGIDLQLAVDELLKITGASLIQATA